MAPQSRPERKSLEARLRELAAPPAPAWPRLRRELAARARAQDLIDVAVERHDSPLGALALGATREGLVRVALPGEEEQAMLDELAARISPRVLCAGHESLTRARRQLDEYFARRRRRFDVPLDWQLARGFRRAVLHATARIPYGQTASYREIAREAGSPRAFRAAGSALARNPLPILVPCHRVLPASGALGQYRGGPQIKAALLRLESGE
jgi:methylated-DNA-[protein]-cysteine S-methyltransferase